MIIYVITNKINGKQYVGQTKGSLEQRWNQHKHYASHCYALKAAISKYGADNFSIEQIDSANSREELNEKERYWIEKLNTLSPNGYNLTTGGDCTTICQETLDKMSKALQGHPVSEETREKLRVAHTGRQASEETKELISQRMKEQWEAGTRKGHPMPDHLKEKLRELSLGRPSWNKGLPPEQQPHFGKPKPKEVREKIAKSLSKPIVCVETGKVYASAQDASKELGIQYSNISRCLHGRSHTCGGYHWRWYDAN